MNHPVAKATRLPLYYRVSEVGAIIRSGSEGSGTRSRLGGIGILSPAKGGRSPQMGWGEPPRLSCGGKNLYLLDCFHPGEAVPLRRDSSPRPPSHVTVATIV